MTDQEADLLIDQARPVLRKAIQQVVSQKTPAVMFSLGLMSFPNQQAWEVSCFVLIEPLAKLIAPLVTTGMPEMFQSQMKPHMKPGEAPPVNNQPAPKGGGLSALLPD